MFEGWAAAAAVVGGSVVGGLVSSSGAQSAAQTQANAANNAQQISQQEFNTITQQEQPFLQGGYGALSNLDYMLGIGPNNAPGNTSSPSGTPGMSYTAGAGGSIVPQLSAGSSGAQATGPTSAAGGYGSLVSPFTAQNFQQLSPAYQFQQQQGMQGVLNGDTSGQGALSGATQKDLIGYNQNLANTSFNNAFNQYQTQQGNIFSRLSGIANLGQSAATNTAQTGTALAGQAAQSATNVGTALAAGQIGSANAISGAVTSAAPWLAYGAGGTSTEVPDESLGVGG